MQHKFLHVTIPLTDGAQIGDNNFLLGGNNPLFCSFLLRMVSFLSRQL